jgi:hypothetical protein
VTGLTNGTTYYFTVAAVNSVGPSASSNEASATPSTVPGRPLSLAIRAGNRSATVFWSPPASTGGSPITGYDVYVGTTSGGELTTPVNATPLAKGAASYVVTGLTNGKRYYVTVRAINADGLGFVSKQRSVVLGTRPGKHNRGRGESPWVSGGSIGFEGGWST